MQGQDSLKAEPAGWLMDQMWDRRKERRTEDNRQVFGRVTKMCHSWTEGALGKKYVWGGEIRTSVLGCDI